MSKYASLECIENRPKGAKFGNFGDPSLSTGAIAKIKRSPFIYLKTDRKCKASLEEG